MTIFELIDDGDAEGVRELLARDPGAAASRDEQGLSALMRSFYRGGGEVLVAILAADPPLDAWDRLIAGESDGLPAPDAHSPDGFTPLHIAAFAHNAAAARTLLAAGADPDELSTASFAQVTPLGTAAAFGANEVAEVLLDNGADTERTSDHGNTPLHAAASNGNRTLVELLLARRESSCSDRRRTYARGHSRQRRGARSADAPSELSRRGAELVRREQ